MIIEVCPSRDCDMVQEIGEIDGVESVSLVSHNGEVTFLYKCRAARIPEEHNYSMKKLQAF